MALANYADLQTAVAGFLHRSDLTDIIPDLIALAEIRINGDLDARMQDTKTTITCVESQEYVALPSDTINIRHLSVATTPVQTLDYMAPDAFYVAHPYGETGIPRAFTVIGSNAYLAPIPDSDYTLTDVYKARVPSLSINWTTWLMTNYPNVYLYATLCEAAPYIKADERVQLWEGRYNEAIDTVNSQDWYSGSTMRVRTDVK